MQQKFRKYILNAAQLCAPLILVVALGCQSDVMEDAKVRVMSFNIRYNNPADGPFSWEYRREGVSKMIPFHQTDIVGIQEALSDQIHDLQRAWLDYGMIGVGRADGKEDGEYSAIFYRLSRFQLLQNGTFWLSETPQDTGSVGWDAALERIATWGILNDRKTQKELFVLNTHFDHIGQQARLESAKLILNKSKTIAKGRPVVISGDFNCDEDSAPYRLLTGEKGDEDQPFLFNARDRSKNGHYGPRGTFPGFPPLNNPAPAIDFIFVSKNIAVEWHGVLAEVWDDLLPSDHRPVVADITLR